MVRFGPKLERRQMVLFRAVDIGAELFAMSRRARVRRCCPKQGRPEAVTLADAFCLEARDRIAPTSTSFLAANATALYKLAMQVLKGEHAWLEQGIVSAVAHPDKAKRRPPEAEAPFWMPNRFLRRSALRSNRGSWILARSVGEGILFGG